MAKQHEWYRWYPLRWTMDEFVRKLDLEGQGLYHHLLTMQMITGSIPEDKATLAKLVGVSVDVLMSVWERNEFFKKFEKMTKTWVSTGDNPEIGYWRDLTEEELLELHKDGVRMFNKKNEQVRSLTDSHYSRKTANARANAQTRNINTINRTVERISTKLAEEEKAVLPDFDWVVVLKDYPYKRGRTRWEEGIELLVNTITTEEEYHKFWAAVRAYKKSMVGQPDKFVKALPRFLGEWKSFIPNNFRYKPKPVESSSETAPEAPSETTTSETTPARRVLGFNERPPWVSTLQTTPTQAKSNAEFWTPERQERWWLGLPPIEEDQVVDQPTVQPAQQSQGST